MRVSLRDTLISRSGGGRNKSRSGGRADGSQMLSDSGLADVLQSMENFHAI